MPAHCEHAHVLGVERIGADQEAVEHVGEAVGAKPRGHVRNHPGSTLARVVTSAEGDDPAAKLTTMSLRTDTFDLGGLHLSTGEGRRLDLAVAIDPFELGGERYAGRAAALSRSDSTSRARPARATRCDCASTRRWRARACAAWSRRRRCSASTRARFRSPARARSSSRRTSTAACSIFCLGARRAGADAPDDAAVPAGLRRSVPGLRRRSELGRPRSPARARARSTLGEAVGIAVRVTCIATMAVPKQKQSHARTTTASRSAQGRAPPTYNACPQCHSPRLPHRVCPVCGNYKGREVIAPGADEPSL